MLSPQAQASININEFQIAGLNGSINNSITNSMTNSMSNSMNNSVNNSMVNIGGTGIIRITKHNTISSTNNNNNNKSRSVTPFSVVQMDLIKVVSKQTLLALIDFIVLLSYAMLVFVSDLSQVYNILFPILVSLQYTITSLAIWLSFEFANKQYQFIFGKCGYLLSQRFKISYKESRK